MNWQACLQCTWCSDSHFWFSLRVRPKRGLLVWTTFSCHISGTIVISERYALAAVHSEDLWAVCWSLLKHLSCAWFLQSGMLSKLTGFPARLNVSLRNLCLFGLAVTFHVKFGIFFVAVIAAGCPDGLPSLTEPSDHLMLTASLFF